MAYHVLNIATFVHRLNHLKDHWCTFQFLIIPFFKKGMGRDTYMNIRSALRTYFRYYPAVAYPLWNRQQILEDCAPYCATLAVPVGVSCSDESRNRCTARTSARFYMTSKQDILGYGFTRSSLRLAHTYTVSRIMVSRLFRDIPVSSGICEVL